MSTDLPLTQHVDTLYPVARVLVGDAGASLLVKHTFRRAASVPAADRPTDTEAWLVDLLLRIHNGDAALDEPPAEDAPAESEADGDTADRPWRDQARARRSRPTSPRPDAEFEDDDSAVASRDRDRLTGSTRTPNPPDTDSGADHDNAYRDSAHGDSAHGDSARSGDPRDSDPREDDALDASGTASGLSFRQEIARTVAKRAIPVALAACSEQERALLALHVTGPRLDTTLTPIARTVADDIGAALDQAYGQLRAALRDVVTGPERMLIDTALPDRALESTLRTHVTENYGPVPARLRSDVAEIIVQKSDSSRDTAPADAPNSPSPTAGENDRRVQHLRRTGAALLVLAVVGGIAYAAATWLSSPETSKTTPAVPSLMQFSVEQAEAIRRIRDVNDPDTAARTLRREFGRRISVPQIDEARLAGIASLSLDTLSIPVLVFVDSTDASAGAASEAGDEAGQAIPGAIPAYVYSYALIDQIEVLARLDDDLAERLDTADRVLTRETDGRALFIWRRGDDVFVAVAGNGDALASRIRP